jgi:hypothetical protein
VLRPASAARVGLQPLPTVSRPYLEPHHNHTVTFRDVTNDHLILWKFLSVAR